MHLAHIVGKWNEFTCQEFYKLIHKRVQQPTYKRKLEIYSDGNDQNIQAILRFWNKDSVRYGQLIKDKEKQRVIGRYKRWIFGYDSYDKISIAHIDGYCARLRERVARFAREAKSYSKKRRVISRILDIQQANNNLIEIKEKGRTPAMIEGLVSEKWSWSRLLHKRLPFV
ncbi:MAG: hypothetical protein JW725_00295 [Candidatus Babeliaceae bacterium]|nr:hypothetical protein [Candidatus Babeliaceae bacterium]